MIDSFFNLGSLDLNIMQVSKLQENLEKYINSKICLMSQAIAIKGCRLATPIEIKESEVVSGKTKTYSIEELNVCDKDEDVIITMRDIEQDKVIYTKSSLLPYHLKIQLWNALPMQAMTTLMNADTIVKAQLEMMQACKEKTKKENVDKKRGFKEKKLMD